MKQTKRAQPKSRNVRRSEAHGRRLKGLTIPSASAQAALDPAQEVLSMLKRGNFSLEMQRKLDQLWSEVKQAAARDQRYYKVAAMVSEVNYYLDRQDKARAAVKDGESVLAELRRTIPADNELELAREQIRFCQAFVQANHYHQHHYQRAQQSLEACAEFVTARLVRDGFRCSGTLAQNSYALGKTYRQMSDYQSAERAFVAAIDYYQERAESRKKAHEKITDKNIRKKRQEEEYLFVNRRIAVVLGLGLGWLDYTRGRLASAYQKVVTAKILFSPYEDKLNNAYLDLICGSIWRCQAGNKAENRSQQEAALTTVERAFTVFGKEQHARYRARAAYELALINLALADQESAGDEFTKYITGAEEKIAEVLDNAKATNSSRWSANALVVKSRIARKLGANRQALAFAREALQTATNSRQDACQIDALIALAEIKIVLADGKINSEESVEQASTLLKEAREQLKKALRLNQQSLHRTNENQNLKIQVVCSLYLATTYAKQGLTKEAQTWLPTEETIAGIEHLDIRRLAEHVEAEMKATVPFPLNSHTPDIRYHGLNEKLQRFLLKTAKQRGAQTRKELAQMMDVDKKTIDTWHQAFGMRA